MADNELSIYSGGTTNPPDNIARDPAALRRYWDDVEAGHVDSVYTHRKRVLVIGHSNAGKTRLLDFYQRYAAEEFEVEEFRKSLNDRDITPGYKVVEVNNVKLFDFAGQFEYYASHSYLWYFENAVIVVVIRLCKDVEETQLQHDSWCNFISLKRTSESVKVLYVYTFGDDDEVEKFISWGNDEEMIVLDYSNENSVESCHEKIQTLARVEARPIPLYVTSVKSVLEKLSEEGKYIVSVR